MTWFPKKTPTVVCPCVHPEPMPSTQVPVASCTNGWISVENQIPEFGIRVLVSSVRYGVISGIRKSHASNGHDWELGMRDTSPYAMYYHPQNTTDVTHWQPMPCGPLC
jgi:Protein of unknown function (DUF551)